MEVKISAALKVELNSIRNQYSHALKSHQYWFDRLAEQQDNPYIKKQLFDLEQHLKTLDDSQRQLFGQLREENANSSNTYLRKRENACQNNSYRSQINSHKMPSSVSGCSNSSRSSFSSYNSGIERTTHVTNIRTPPPPPLTSAPGVKLPSRNIQPKISAKGGRKTSIPKSSPPLHISSKNSASNKNEVSKKDINDKNLENESPEDRNSSNLSSEPGETYIIREITQKEFLRALNLVTREELFELQNKRVERKRKSTANHSQFVYDDSWDSSKRKRGNYLNNGQTAASSTRQITRSQVKRKSKSEKTSPPAASAKSKVNSNNQASKRKKSNSPSDEDVRVNNNKTNGLKENKEIVKRNPKTPSPPPLKPAPSHVKKLIQQEKRIQSMDKIIRRDESSSSVRGCSLIVRSEPPSSDRYKRCVDSVHINRIGVSPIEDLTLQALNIQKLPASLTIERVGKDQICVVCRKLNPQSVCHKCASPYHNHDCGNTGKCRMCDISGLAIVQQYLQRTEPKSMTISSHPILNCSTPFSSMKTSLNSMTVTTVPAQTNKLKIDKKEKTRLLVVNRELMSEKEKLESRKAELNKKIQDQSDFRRTLEASEIKNLASIQQIQEFVQKMRNDPALTTLTIANLEIEPSRPFMSS